jgi:hypothetical protein
MLSKRRLFLKNIVAAFPILCNSIWWANDVGIGEYDAVDLLRDLSEETRSAQIATADMIDTVKDSGGIRSVEISNEGTSNATIQFETFRPEEGTHIYNSDNTVTLGYEYQSEVNDLGNRFVDLENNDKLADVLEQFYELYVPELFDKPASVLIDNQTETESPEQTDQTEEGTPEQASSKQPTYADGNSKNNEENEINTHDPDREINEPILSPFIRDIFTIMGGTGVTILAIYRYASKRGSEDDED